MADVLGEIKQATNKMTKHMALLILNLKPGYAESELKSAWRMGVVATHPDKNPHPGAIHLHKLVNEAYAFLRGNVDSEPPLSSGTPWTNMEQTIVNYARNHEYSQNDIDFVGAPQFGTYWYADIRV